MPQHDLYGDQLPTQYAVEAARQPELFGPMGSSGSAWMRAAEAWAAERGLAVRQWRADKHFKAGARSVRNVKRLPWLAIGWTGERWTVSPI